LEGPFVKQHVCHGLFFNNHFLLGNAIVRREVSAPTNRLTWRGVRRTWRRQWAWICTDLSKKMTRRSQVQSWVGVLPAAEYFTPKPQPAKGNCF